ncbi:MAG: hypothetical protein A2W30_02350 [Ignavibacteria bacterium RBG_16_36_9]|nr:MAG: hypothetical protein A2W30_02350 [Ignavibacteria bacterium RBG_16_36_9]
MKNLLLTLSVFSVLLLIGCQENSITDPILTESVQKVQTTGENLISGSIPLEGLLVIHGGFQTYYSISGQIDYTHELVLLDPAPPAPQYYIDLNLSVIATLTDEGHNAFRISSQSEDNIYVSEDGIYILEKSFPVLGRNDGMVLVCRFLVTTDGIGLNSMWLDFTNDISNNFND